VGRIGSVVRVSVSFQQKYTGFCPTMSYGRTKRSYNQGGYVRGRVDLPSSRRITSSPSKTLRRHLVRTTDDGRRGVLDARGRPSRLYFFTLRD